MSSSASNESAAQQPPPPREPHPQLQVMEKLEALTSTLIEQKKDTDEQLHCLSVELAQVKSLVKYPDFEAVEASAVYESETMVYIFPNGWLFHKIGFGSCSHAKSNLNDLTVPKKLAVALYRFPCKKCFP
jgi:hypothetical protein